MKIAVYTRSMNEEYYQLMTSLLPKEILLHRVTGMNHWKEAKDYLHYVINHAVNNGIEYAINIDEDCFITDWDKITCIIATMEYTYTHAGMPDGGFHPGRARDYRVQNPFFNVFNIKLIKFVMSKTKLGFDSKLKKPNFDLMPYGHGGSMKEPFDAFFIRLYKKGNPLHLYADLHEDLITTILKWSDKPFALHTWYSRDASHRDRILQRFEEAKQLK